MQVSFGKKIPISKCKIKNKKTQQFERATIYEVECRDETDMEYIANALKGKWKFRYLIDIAARSKKDLLPPKEGQCGVRSFYFQENKSGEVVGVCVSDIHKVREAENNNVDFIETSPKKEYEFAGQTLLANLAKLSLRSGYNMTIEHPLDSADKFYSDVCQFKPYRHGYILPMGDVKSFVEMVEDRTQGEIIDCKV